MQRPFSFYFIRKSKQSLNTLGIFVEPFYNEVNPYEYSGDRLRPGGRFPHPRSGTQLKRLDAFDDYSFGGTALVGDPTDPDTLRQGGIDSCDAVAAVSEDDSVNLMAAQIAKSIFRREKVICRVSDPHLQVLYHKAYEIDTICPTVLTEQSVFRALAK